MELFFDAKQVDLESTAYPKDIIPDGQYIGMITDSAMIDSKNGDKSLRVSIGIAKGSEAGKVFEEWIARRCNKNPKRVAMGEKMLARLILACGKEKIRDTKELHDIPFSFSLVTKKGYQNIEEIEKLAGGIPARTPNPGFDVETTTTETEDFFG